MGIGAVLVMQKEQLVGILTERDILDSVGAGQDPDAEARQFVAGRMRELGLEVRHDEVGNLRGRRAWIGALCGLPQMTPLLAHFGPRICRGKRLVGYWWWELDRMPRAWACWRT